MNEKQIKIYERCKNEVSELQFNKLVKIADAFKNHGWKNAHVDVEKSVNGNIVIEVQDTAGRKHLYKVFRDGRGMFLPFEMRCKD